MIESGLRNGFMFFFYTSHRFPRFQTIFQIHLVMMKFPMFLLLSHKCFWEFSKISSPPPPVDWTSEICSADFKPTCIRLITINLAMRLLLSCPSSVFSWNFSKNQNSIHPWTGLPKFLSPIYNQLPTIGLQLNLMFVVFSLFHMYLSDIVDASCGILCMERFFYSDPDLH